MDIARPEFRREAVTLRVEDEERVIADRLEVAVVRGLLLGSVDRALGAVDIESHPPGRRSRRSVLDQSHVEASKALIVILIGEDVRLEQCSVDVRATLVSLRSREASIRNVGSSASRSASLVSS